MHPQVLFIQGGGEGGYEADVTLTASLKASLGNGYEVHYPKLESDEKASDFGWIRQIESKISEIEGNVIVVGHSLGASMILKYLSEKIIPKKIAGIFLISTPFWSGDEDWKKGLKLQDNFADKISKEIPIYFYHSHDDEVAPFSNFELYGEKLAHATFRDVKIGGHQLNNDLALIARDIKSLLIAD